MARKATKRASAKKKPATKRKSAARKPAAKKKTATKKKSAARKSTASRTVRAAAKPAVQAKAAKSRKATKPKNNSTLAYTQSEFLDNIKDFCGFAKKAEAREIWEDISAFITDSLKKGYRVPLVGLGKMYVRKSKARMGRNPATGEMIHIAAKKRVRFTPAKALKDTVL